MNKRTACELARRCASGVLAVAALAVATSAGNNTLPPQGGWVADSALDAQIAQDVRAIKPPNPWTTTALREAGFKGCASVLTNTVTYDNPPTGHVVRLPVSEGWNYVVMPAREVADRMAAFGGTTTTADDVKVVGNCY